MKHVLVQPCGSTEAVVNYNKTITNSVPLSRIKPFLTAREFAVLESLNVKKIPVWGMRPEGRQKTAPKSWRDLESGDMVLFYSEKYFHDKATCISKIHSPKLAQELWGDAKKQGLLFEYVYFVKDVQRIVVKFDPKIIWYKANKFQKTTLLRGTKAKAMQEYIAHYRSYDLGDISKELAVSETFSEKVIEKVGIPQSVTDLENILMNGEEQLIGRQFSVADKRRRIATVYDRNPVFARLVKERDKYICQICGKRPFLKKNGEPYAEAHHIDVLSETGIDDPRRMITVCAECHRVIHYGSGEALQERLQMRD